MNKSNRMQMLEQMLKEDPKDPFLHQAYALEFRSTAPSKTYELLKDLKQKQPDYLPCYYPLAELAAAFQDFKLAQELYLKAIEIAKEQKEAKTEQELKNAYDEFYFEFEDELI